MNINKQNSYSRTVDKIVFDWYQSNSKVTSSKFVRLFGFRFSNEAFDKVFVTKETSIPVTAAYKLLDQLGYTVSFTTIHGEITFDGDFRALLQKIVHPYRPQYLMKESILTRSRYDYIINRNMVTGRLHMSVLDFTYLLYKLNIKMVISSFKD